MEDARRSAGLWKSAIFQSDWYFKVAALSGFLPNSS